jgi:hypothetical protein
MGEGSERESWNHTADLLAHLSNLNRSQESSRVWTREDFHPFLKKEAAPIARTSDPRDLATMKVDD